MNFEFKIQQYQTAAVENTVSVFSGLPSRDSFQYWCDLGKRHSGQFTFKENFAGKEVFSVNNGFLIACFDEDVNEEVITAVAKRKPYYFIVRDKSLSSDNVADNFEQIFLAYSKDTIRRIL